MSPGVRLSRLLPAAGLLWKAHGETMGEPDRAQESRTALTLLPPQNEQPRRPYSTVHNRGRRQFVHSMYNVAMAILHQPRGRTRAGGVARRPRCACITSEVGNRGTIMRAIFQAS